MLKMKPRFTLFKEREVEDKYEDLRKILRRIEKRRKISFIEEKGDSEIEKILSMKLPILMVENRIGCSYLSGMQNIGNYLKEKYHSN